VVNDPVAALSQDWKRSGIRCGDTLLLHSNTTRTLVRLNRLGFQADIKVILDSFLDAIGPEGTLLLPLFNFGFCSGVPFDIRTTPSEMGVLTEAARIRAEAVRTGHPVYSFAVLGRRKDIFRGVDNFSGYGADSPFGILHKEGGRIATLDLPEQRALTFYHYIEESLSVDYRFHKRFSALYTDVQGNSCERTYGLFVRKIDQGVVTLLDPMGDLLWARGLYCGDRPGKGSGLRVIDARSLYEQVATVIGQGRARGLLYEIEEAVA
jgi:aminoglycoside 3-N-acetyltransferase